MADQSAALEALLDLADVAGGVLFVHAHPDDETITTGATMAGLAAAGVPVTLVTCTRGELGEVIGQELAALEGDGPALARHREGELRAAMEALGVADHRFLGAAHGVRYTDSGMVWGPDGLATTPPDVSPDAFAVADLDAAAGQLAEVIDELRPTHVVSYEPGGGYGHPDHVQAARVAARAVELAQRGGHEHRPQLLWVLTPESVDDAGRAVVAAAGLRGRDPSSSRPSMVVPDGEVAYRFGDWSRSRPEVSAKVEGLRAHRSQVVVSQDEQFFALSNLVWQPISAVEYFAPAP